MKRESRSVGNIPYTKHKEHERGYMFFCDAKSREQRLYKIPPNSKTV
jgi:hypothetical protein